MNNISTEDSKEPVNSVQRWVISIYDGEGRLVWKGESEATK